jgi:hypothetical protein
MIQAAGLACGTLMAEFGGVHVEVLVGEGHAKRSWIACYSEQGYGAGWFRG